MGKKKFMSRRAILHAAGLTPAALMMLSVSAEAEAQIAAAISGYQLKNDEGIRFGRVCQHLWAAFAIGAGDSKLEGDILNTALGLSGTAILSNLAKFPDDGKDVHTLVCGYICGTKAASKAGANKIITAAIFTEAWNETQAEAAAMFAQARKNGAGPYSGLAC